MTASPPPLPAGWGLRWATGTQGVGDVLVGGAPRRVLRLTPAGALVARRLRTEPVSGPAEGRLARRLVDAGMASPVPDAAGAPPEVTVLVPVADRARELERCLSALGDEHPVVVVDDASADPDRLAAVARRHGALLVRRDVRGGPGAARTTGLEHVRTAAVALLDSDCLPPAGWPSGTLLAHLADPAVAAVAPRVRACAPPPAAGTAARYAAGASPLDMGAGPAEVRRDGVVRYVPTAALVIRRAALGGGFDPALRHGEDVDLVWRMAAGGWRVRYEPSCEVAHAEPGSWRELLVRRHRYGTSAGPLARRHPGALAPLVLTPVPTLVLGLLLARRPAAAVAVGAAGAALLAPRLHAAGAPAGAAVPSTVRAVLATADGGRRWLAQVALVPVVVGAARRRHPAPALLVLLVLGPVVEWARTRPRLDPVRWTLARLADDAAYGSGVVLGAVRARTPSAVLPAVRGLPSPASVRGGLRAGVRVGRQVLRRAAR